MAPQRGGLHAGMDVRLQHFTELRFASLDDERKLKVRDLLAARGLERQTATPALVALLLPSLTSTVWYPSLPRPFAAFTPV